MLFFFQSVCKDTEKIYFLQIFLYILCYDLVLCSFFTTFAFENKRRQNDEKEEITTHIREYYH